MIDKNKVYSYLNKVLSFAQSHYKNLNGSEDISTFFDHPDRITASKLFSRPKQRIDPAFSKLNSDEQKLAIELLNKYGMDASQSSINNFGSSLLTGVAAQQLKSSGNIAYGGAVYKPIFDKNGNPIRYKNLAGGENMPTMEDILQSDEQDARNLIFKKGYMINRDDNGNITLINPEKEAEKYAQINKYKDLMSRQEDELTKQYASQANKTDWVKVTIYIIIAIIVAYIVYRIVKWLYRWYKKRKASKQLQKNESVNYNFFNYRLCEADESHIVGKIYNSMITPIVNFFKKIFSGSVLSYITSTISKFSGKIYQWFTKIFRDKKPVEELKDQYNQTLNAINELSKNPLLRNKISSITNVMPEL